jgi:hypothetical protein
MPTKREIDDALYHNSIHLQLSSLGSMDKDAKDIAVLAAAYHAEKEYTAEWMESAMLLQGLKLKQEARADLAERQYAEVKAWTIDKLSTPETIRQMLARHEAERKALASQAIDKASEPRNDADASGDLPAREGQL